MLLLYVFGMIMILFKKPNQHMSLKCESSSTSHIMLTVFPVYLNLKMYALFSSKCVFEASNGIIRLTTKFLNL